MKRYSPILPICIAQLLVLDVAYGVVYGASNVIAIHAPPISDSMNHLLEDTAQFALHALNNQQGTSNLSLERVLTEEAKITQGLLVDVGVQFGYRPEIFQFQFVQVLQENGIAQPSLPSGESSLTLFELPKPRFNNIALHGPLHLQFTHPQNDLRFNLPHSVEADSIRKIRVASDVSVTASGITSVRLMEGVEVELKSSNKSVQGMSIVFKQAPRLEIKGDNMHFRSNERTKVKRTGGFDVELVNGTSTPHPFSYWQSQTVELMEDNPFVQFLKHMLESTKSIMPGANEGQLRSIHSGTAEAVTLMLLPMELQEDTGIRSKWNVIVTQDTKGHRQVVSSERQPSRNEISVVPGLLHNSTIPEILERIPVESTHVLSF